MSEKKAIRPKSCVHCTWCWYHEASYGEVVSEGPSGWVCDGRKNGGVANLKHFPFITQQACFQGK